MPPSALVWLAVQVLGCAANAAWRRSCHSQPSGGSYARWREPFVSLVFIVYGFGLGATSLTGKHFMDSLPAPAAAAAAAAAGKGASAQLRAAALAAHHFFLVFFESHVPINIFLWIARPVRIQYALPAHLVAVVSLARHNRYVCAGGALAHPAALRLTERLHSALAWLRGVLAPPAAHAASPRGQQQCAALQSCAQLVLGLVLPAAWHSSHEAALFERHQAERAAAGLPAEKGWQAWMYRRVGELRPAGGWRRGHSLLAAWALLGAAWNLAVAIS